MKQHVSLKGESVFVTGGTGFIGSHLCRKLVNDGASVSVLARGNCSLDLISDINDRLKLYRAEITDAASLMEIMKEAAPKFVFHLAANIDLGHGPDSVTSLIETNLVGTINMLNASKEAGGVEKFVFLGTSDVYGASEGSCSENYAADPISSYGASKAAAELFCRCLAREYNIPWTILRPFIVYGEGQAPGMFIPQMISTVLKGDTFAMTGGKQTRDFLYVGDFVKACIKAAEDRGADGETINIASGRETPLSEVADLLTSIMDKPVNIELGALPYRKNERWHVKADISKACRILDWAPETDLTEGLKKTIQWYKNSTEGHS